MLRTAVLVFAFGVLALGAYLCTKGIAHGGIQVLAAGALFVIGTLFERWRYHNKNAAIDGEWEPTGERFVDPATGKNMQVFYDPQSGERRYQPSN